MTAKDGQLVILGQKWARVTTECEETAFHAKKLIGQGAPATHLMRSEGL
jgi:hypothetical protein